MPSKDAKAISNSKPKVETKEPVIKSGVIQLHGYRPRCWASISQTIQVNNFEPNDFTLGYEEDVQTGETKEQVMARIKQFLKQQIAPEIKILTDAKNKNK